MIYKFDDITFQFIVFIPVSLILYAVMCMVISSKIQHILILVERNKELIATVSNILKIFPEGVIIKSWSKKLQQMIINLANDTAQKELLRYPDPENKPIQDQMLDYKGK